MTLLDFARGPAMQWSLVIFSIGVCWRLAGIFLLHSKRDWSQPRRKTALQDGTRAIVMRSLPPHELEKNIVFQHVTGYLWHIGFFVTILFFGPHIPFFKSILGFSWPHISNVMIMIAAAVTLSVLVMLLVRRIIHPVLQKISTADDYISVIITILPLITGFMSYANLGFIKETNLALHIMSFQLILLWYPFGKLMHLFLVFPSRFRVGARFGRRGVRA
jgi:nitrate reductase gamma subunit